MSLSGVSCSTGITSSGLPRAERLPEISVAAPCLRASLLTLPSFWDHVGPMDEWTGHRQCTVWICMVSCPALNLTRPPDSLHDVARLWQVQCPSFRRGRILGQVMQYLKYDAMICKRMCRYVQIIKVKSAQAVEIGLMLTIDHSADSWTQHRDCDWCQ